jgi:hypothetical protein
MLESLNKKNVIKIKYFRRYAQKMWFTLHLSYKFTARLWSA